MTLTPDARFDSILKRASHTWRMWRTKGAAKMSPRIWLGWVLFGPVPLVESQWP